MYTPATFAGRKSAQNQSIRDVIISGAGPVGLFLACELALAKMFRPDLGTGGESALATKAAAFRNTGNFRAIR